MKIFKLVSVLISLAFSPVFSADNVPFYQASPAISTIPIEKTPMFVSIGWDDNGHADGMEWFLNFTDSLRNPDNSYVRTTYFITAGFGSNDSQEVTTNTGTEMVPLMPDADYQTVDDVRNAWKHIRNSGNEVGNHSWNHPHGASLSLEQWQNDQMGKCIDSLNKWIGIPKDSIFGFRTPYLEYDGPATMGAIQKLGMLYDCSVEWGFNGFAPDAATGDPDVPMDVSKIYWNSATSPRTHKKLFWPYTLDNGAATGNSAKGAVTIPGLWEFMVYTILKADNSGVITGFDYNTWAVQDTGTWLATMKHNFDLHRSQGDDGDDLVGNKAPFIINAHTDYYSEYNESANTTFTKSTWQGRRKAMEELIKYITSFSDTRIVPMVKIIDWMKNPVELGDVSVSPNTQLTKNNPKISLKALGDNKVNLTISKKGNYKINLYSINGKEVASVHSGILNYGEYTVDLSAKKFSKGMFILKISGDATASFKIINK